ncbi:(5-formylfuran-3-yl)methyl phosphate synthase [Candidatus Methylocalor cossyra]|uniref:(5-formylfuran-3-yl)methyl phosphate synthase n=1 Tax=Candidatus Methylocalor cossyra TaxID=3108543 RepID=A0ABM9NI87_9GAMM
MTGMLASVANLAEARLVAAAGVDIIDLKDPARGVLGALALPTVADLVAALGGRHRLSATLGDLAMDPARVIPAARAMAATGVAYVKIGFFPGGDWPGVIAGLAPLAAEGARLVAVLFGDRAPELGWIPPLAAAGFVGAMLDTADKGAGSLPQVCPGEFLSAFVAAVRRQGLLSGLAGSLRSEDLDPLLALDPDYLGFRGALCGGNRTGAIQPEAVRALVARIKGEGQAPARVAR